MRIIASFILFFVAVKASTRGGARRRHSRHHRVLARQDNGKPSFLTGVLGNVPQGLVSNPSAVASSAKSALESILDVHVGFDASRQDLNVVKTGTDRRSGDYHIRVKATIDGLPVDGASMMMHVDRNGRIYALNGELVTTNDLIENKTSSHLTCEEAFGKAMANSMKYHTIGVSGQWITDCELLYVHAMDGTIHKAWKRTYEYTHPKEENRYGVDDLYASVVNGDLVAYLPQIKGGLSIVTSTCNYTSACNVPISNSMDNIATSDVAANAAHNAALATYNLFQSLFGRDSLDNAGMTLRSHVHYGKNYNNAFWNGYGMYYGDGDGITFRSFSLAADVVGHEFAHGWTNYESNLVYSGESGALNEAMSDIIGACVERIMFGKSVQNTWLIGEDISVQPGFAIRDMANPASRGSSDYYPTRYLGAYDNGGVHTNSGIANLAFVLMVQGGRHPRGVTTNSVPAIHADFTTSLRLAARIFYDANTNCMTPTSTFRDTRLCTEQFAGNYLSSVRAAWDAVGVSDIPLVATEVVDGVLLSGQSAARGQVLHFALREVQFGETVRCTLTGSNGNADLYMRLHDFALVDRMSPANSCYSAANGSNDTCTTKVIDRDNSTVYAAVVASSAFTNLSIRCARNPVSVVALRNGALLANQTAGRDQLQYFKLEGITKGSTVKINIASNAAGSDADLYVRFGSLPNPFDSSKYDCAGLSYTSTESCTLTAPSDTTLFILTHAYSAYQGLSVEARSSPSPILLLNGVALTGSSSETAGLLQDYRLRSIQAGESVECSLVGSSGDADLFVRFSNVPVTTTTSPTNSCSSATLGTSNEMCTTPVATATVDAYATVYTTSPYSGLAVTCRRVKSSALDSTKNPTKRPTPRPTRFPTPRPTKRPTKAPTKCRARGQHCLRNLACCSRACRKKRCA
jgi:vibriolysin